MGKRAKAKRELTPAQREGLERSRGKRREGLERARAARAAQRSQAGSTQAEPVSPGPSPSAQPDLAAQHEPAAALGTQVEPGVSPLQATPPPEVPPPEVVARVEAARAALGTPPGQAPGAAPGAAPLPPAPVIVDPRLCVGLVELANDVTIRVMANSNGIAITPEVEKLTKLDPDVKRNLEALAPFAVPYLQELLAKGPIIGALIFGGVAIVAIASNTGKLKKHAPKRAPGKDKAASETGVEAPAAPQTQVAPSTSSAIWPKGRPDQARR
jgi:hypothetical protein